VIGVELLPETLLGDRPRPLPGPIQVDGNMSFYETMERLEREIIVGTLKSVNGVQRKAAARLGLNPTTLNEKIKRLKIQVR
jgi:transcriptional regulator with GAF, ATPase, and Fis domain